MFKDKRSGAEKQEKSKMLEEKLVKMLWPVLVELDGAFQPGGSAETDQAWLLQSTGWTTDLCTWLSLAASAGERTSGSTHPGSHALVDDAS